MTDSPAEQAVAAFYHNVARRKRRKVEGSDTIYEAIVARIAREKAGK